MWQEIHMKKAVECIESFQNATPLNAHIKEYCRRYSNMGARDRKLLHTLVFNFYRLKGNRHFADTEVAITVASLQDTLAAGFVYYWMQKIAGNSSADLSSYLEFTEEEYFPLAAEVTKNINRDTFFRSHIKKPNIFIRCREDHMNEIIKELNALNYKFQRAGDETLSFETHYALDKMKTYERGYFEIQDIASQRTGKLLHPHKNELWWDCCAGSGGKTLMLLDKQSQLQLTVSDARMSILQNLQERLQRCGYTHYKSLVLDLRQPEDVSRESLPLFDNIIADVPCSGSGTWSRSPEWLSFFTSAHLSAYVQDQRRIVSNVLPKLKTGGSLLYITCSVYAAENEDNLAWFSTEPGLEVEQQNYVQYSTEGGDTLFTAKLRKK